MSKDVRICGYFPTLKRGPRAKYVWETLVYVNKVDQCRVKITYSFQFVNP